MTEEQVSVEPGWAAGESAPAEPASVAEMVADSRPRREDRSDRVLRQLGALDRAVYGAVADTPTPDLDDPLARLSDAASYSKLWVGIAGGIALLEGRRGRRAAVTGLVAIGVTSAVVKQGIKRLYPRQRPDRDGEDVPQARRYPGDVVIGSLVGGGIGSAVATAARRLTTAAAQDCGKTPHSLARITASSREDTSNER